MKYLILALSFILCSNAYSQPRIPDLIIPIKFTFQLGGFFTNMQVGLDSTATDCIDPQLGESELPPVPPPGWLAIIRLPYPECQNIIGDPILVHTDFRFGEIPFTGTKIHEFWFRSDLGATIHWNLPDGVTGLLQDPWGVGIVSVSMAGQDSFFVPYNLINDLNMILYYVNVIPVEFTSFTASVLQNEKVVQLNWQTATETNNMGFEIERLQNSKIDGLSEWKKIGFVQGFGTTTEPKSYSFIDKVVTTGIYKYRLKQIDYDGSFEYSNIAEVAVGNPSGYLLEQNYPNPFNSSTIIKYQIPKDERVRINLYNILGEKILTLFEGEQESGEHQIRLSSDKLPSGNYFYSLEAASTRQIKKLTIIK